jgi:hypothetical protein
MKDEVLHERVARALAEVTHGRYTDAEWRGVWLELERNEIYRRWVEAAIRAVAGHYIELAEAARDWRLYGDRPPS